MHAAACPSQATQALCFSGWESGVAGAATKSRLPCVASLSPPGDSVAGTARCASRGCRQVFGLVDAEGVDLPPSPSLPGMASQCNDGFVSTYRCGAAPDSHRLPFSSRSASYRNRRTQHSGVRRGRQHQMWCGTQTFRLQGFHACRTKTLCFNHGPVRQGNDGIRGVASCLARPGLYARELTTPAQANQLPPNPDVSELAASTHFAAGELATSNPASK